MKYEISKKNLQYAYKKLKNYYYYYRSSNYLKRDLLEFEENWHDDRTFDDFFQRLASKLLNLETKRKSGRIPGTISYEILPKRDKFEAIGLEKATLSDFNVFIKMPIEFHLLDILFILNVYDKLSHTDIFTNKYSFGNTFDSEFIKSKGDIRSPLLFGSYSNNYKKWKETPLIAFAKNSDEKAILINFDLEKCFYNFDFDMSGFIHSVFGDEYSLVNELEIEIHNLYSYIFDKEVLLTEKESNRSLLPVGLLSSGVILNYYLFTSDNSLSKNAMSLARYADDHYLLCKYKEEFSSLDNNDEVLLHAFPNDFIYEKDKLYLRVGNKKLPVNRNKIKLHILDKKDKLNMHIESTEVSFFEDYDIDTEFINDPVVGNTVKGVRTVIYDRGRASEDVQNYISEMDSVTILNAFPVWNSLFEKCKDREVLERRIARAIDGIRIKDYASLLPRLKADLFNELEVCKEISKENSAYQKHFLYNIDQQQTFNYIQNHESLLHAVYPLRISKTQIMFFLQTMANESIDNDLSQKVLKIYNQVNGLENRARATFTVKKKRQLLKIEKTGKRKKTETAGIPIVAIVNLNMPIYTDIAKDDSPELKENRALIDYDLKNVYTSGINENTFFNLIDRATEQGASYIVFPEFAIPFSLATRILSHCFQKRISLIGGLTHLVYSDKQAINCTVAYSYPLSKVFIHKKRYLPKSEIDLLENEHLKARASKNSYFVIDDNALRYSVMTCYELTNIADRALMKDMTNAVFVPVYNRDTTYFSNIIASFARDIQSYIVQANTNGYGDARITGPFHSYNSDIVKVKGGKNNYFVIGELDIEKLNSSENMPKPSAPGCKQKYLRLPNAVSNK